MDTMPLAILDFLHITLTDVLDILMVAAIIFLLFRWLRGSSAMNVFVAVILLYLIKVIVSAVTSFLSGGLIPLTIFPPLFREIAQRLPFAACQSTPLLIYSGTLQGAAIAEAMGLQLFWLVALVALGCWWMHGTLKRVVVLGG